MGGLLPRVNHHMRLDSALNVSPLSSRGQNRNGGYISAYLAYVWYDWVFLFLSLFHFSSEPFCIPDLQASTVSVTLHSVAGDRRQEGGRERS